jgi:hypothetical protein
MDRSNITSDMLRFFSMDFWVDEVLFLAESLVGSLAGFNTLYLLAFRSGPYSQVTSQSFDLRLLLIVF